MSKEILPDPKTLVDSVADGAVSAIQFFPRAATKVAEVQVAYASSINRNFNELKSKMPEEPAVIPRMLGSMVGETVGAVIGLFEAVVGAGSETARDIKSQITRVTG